MSTASASPRPKRLLPAPLRDLIRRPAPGLVVFTLYDAAVCACAMGLAVRLRSAFVTDTNVEIAAAAPSSAAPWAAAAVFGGVCAVTFPLMGAHRGVWRFTDLRDLLRVLRALLVANLVFVPLWFLMTRLEGFPRSSLAIEAPFAALALIAPRVATAMAAGVGWRAIVRRERKHRPAAVLVGGPDALDAFLRESDCRGDDAPYRPRLLVTLEDGQAGRVIRGRRIAGGLDQIEAAVTDVARAEGAPPAVIVVEAPLQCARLDAIVAAAGRLDAPLVRPHGTPGRNGVAPLDVADLLNRPRRRYDADRVRSLITGRRVLVTGAGGTIGGELSRQIARYEPARLSLLDSSEYGLYEIELALRENGVIADAFFGDVRDRMRVREVMAEAAPEVVLHAAALKHVPLMEANPAEAVLTNVLGTVNVAETARTAGADSFILISTDKAVRPTNVMGASKRAAELFVQALDADGGRMRACSVRFGNVLGSSGSVVPLFERQIARGGPITVTDPEITRYFMTTEEAAALVLQAGALSKGLSARGGGVFALDMGEPVRIEDLARRLCRLRGLEPGADIAIVHTGLRPGEKLHEAMFYAAEEVRDTDADGVLVALAPMIPLRRLRPSLESLITEARRRDIAGIRAAFAQLTPEFADIETRSAA